MKITKPSKQLSVSAIKNGTVIDHITAGSALKIIRILNLPAHQKIVTVGLNLPSRAMGAKDLIKVEGRELTPEEANRVAILAPNASINIVKNYEIAKKFTVNIPERIEHLLVCPNPKCITNNEAMESVFEVIPNGKETKLRCHYCEKTFSQNDIKDYKI